MVITSGYNEGLARGSNEIIELVYQRFNDHPFNEVITTTSNERFNESFNESEIPPYISCRPTPAAVSCLARQDMSRPTRQDVCGGLLLLLGSLGHGTCPVLPDRQDMSCLARPRDEVPKRGAQFTHALRLAHKPLESQLVPACLPRQGMTTSIWQDSTCLV